MPAGPTAPEALYAEPSVRGQQVIRPNHGEAFSKVDLEILFNALTGSSSALATYLTQLQHEPVL